MAGFLLVACVLWTALAFELPLNAAWMCAVLAAIAALGGIIGFRRGRRLAPEPREPRSTASKLAMGISLLLAAGAITDGVPFRVATPVAIKDEATNWTSKAKQLFVAGGFNETLDRDLHESLAFAVRAPRPNYPNLVPLIHLWSYVNAGRIVHFENRIPVLLFRYALLLALAGALLRRSGSPVIGLLLLPAAFNLVRRDEGADSIAAFGLLVTVDALARTFDGAGGRWFRLSALGAACLGSAKHEGQVLLVAVALGAIFQLVRARGQVRIAVRELAWLAAPAAAIASTWWFNRRFDVWNLVVAAQADGSTFAGRAIGHLADRGPRFAAETWNVLAGVGLDARLLHVVFLLLVVVRPRAAFGREAGWITLVVLLAWAGMIPIFLGTPYPFEWFVSVALARVMDQWAPLICLWIAMLWRQADSPGRGDRFGRILVAACILATVGGPLFRLARADVPAQIHQAAPLWSAPEDERLARYLGMRWDCFRALRDDTPAARPVVLIQPLTMESSDVWSQFTALLYPKPVLTYIPGGEALNATLRQHHIDYDNSIDAVAKLAGPAFDVVVFEGSGPLPERLSIEVRERLPGCTIGLGSLRD